MNIILRRVPPEHLETALAKAKEFLQYKERYSGWIMFDSTMFVCYNTPKNIIFRPV